MTGRGLANAYAQTLGTIFTQESKPYEVEIVVAEVGETADDDQIYRLTYDGSVADEHGFVAMGGQAEPITTALTERWRAGMTLSEALALAVELLGRRPGRRRAAPAHRQPARGRDARARAGRAASSAASPARRCSGLLGQEAEPGDVPATEGTHPDEREVSPPTSLAGGSHEPSGPDPAGSEPSS